MNFDTSMADRRFRENLGTFVEILAENDVILQPEKSAGALVYVNELCWSWNQAKTQCESPIEALLLSEIFFGRASCGFWLWDGMRCGPKNADTPETFRGVVFKVQAPIGSFRADFLFSCICYGKQKKFAVECDGHDFHERTKEQARRDRSRDRVFLKLDIPVLRFTGSEIFANPVLCCREIEGMVRKSLSELEKASDKDLIATDPVIGGVQ